MARKPKLSIEAEIYEAKLKIAKAYDDYMTALYFETMPKIDPLYKYCYQTSNHTIPGYEQNIDYWLRAVIKHMGLRHAGHGGERTKSYLVSVSNFTNEKARDAWIDYQMRELKKRCKIVKPKVK